MIRLLYAAAFLLVAPFTMAPSCSAFVPIRGPQRLASHPFAAKKSDPGGRPKEGDDSFLHKAMEFFDDSKKTKRKQEEQRTVGESLKAAFGIREEKKQDLFETHRDAAKAALKDASEAIASLTTRHLEPSGDEQTADVDEFLLNRLRVHAEKILSDDDDSVRLLGGEPVEMGGILSRRPSAIVVDGTRKTEGIRAFVEVSGAKKSGTALVVGDRRGVLLLKLTVGGTTLDVKVEKGLDVDLAHGIKKLRP